MVIVPQHSRGVQSFVIATAAASMVFSAAAAFDDKEFCVVAQQLTVAAQRDVGIWVDRGTRNAGMAVACESKVVEYLRFTYMASASMNTPWKERMAAGWNSSQCSSPLWLEALRNDWKVTLSIWSADGGHISIDAKCR